MAMVRLTVEIPDDVAGDRSPVDLASEARMLLVLDRFRRGEFGSGRAARLLGIGRVAFLDLAAEHGVSTFGYDADDLQREVERTRQARARL